MAALRVYDGGTKSTWEEQTHDITSALGVDRNRSSEPALRDWISGGVQF